MKSAKASICKALLSGKILNIKNAFTLFGITNLPREMTRSIEHPFQIRITRVPRTGKSRYGKTVTWVDYQLDATKENQLSRRKMMNYVMENSK